MTHQPRLFLLLIILFLSFQSVAQRRITEFSEEPEKFLKELKSFVESSDKPPGKDIYKQFEEHYLGGSFTAYDIETIRNHSVALLKKRGRGEHFASYLQVLLALNEGLIDQESRNEWQNALEYMLDKRNFQLNKIESFFFSTYMLIQGDFIYRTEVDYTAQWKSNGADYQFEFANDELLIRFEKLDLSCYAKDDSIRINATSGYYNPIDMVWYGEGGKVTWENAGFSPDSVHALLNDYSIELKRSMYEADSVQFIHRSFSDEYLLGKLTDKIVTQASETRISYPRFVTYAARITIPDIYPGIDYAGSFSMFGNRFMSIGADKQDAYLTFKQNDTVFMRCASPEFAFGDGRIVSDRSAVTIYLNQDSIYHPGLAMRYANDKKEVVLLRDGEGVTQTPFLNSYHQIDMDFEQILWKVGEPRLIFSMMKGGESGTAVFESAHYFSSERYYAVQGKDAQHPFSGLIRYYNRYLDKEFTATEYANFIRMPITPVRQLLMRLSYLGVIHYQVETEKIILRDRLFYYVRAVSGVEDYDVISMNSSPGNKENASLNLLTKDLKIYGVPLIQLSDSQNVVIYPSRGEILMKKNRDFEFEGKVEAGKFDFYGKSFRFSYENFKVDLDNIDSLRIWVESRDKDQNPILVQVRTVIEDITGDLIIDLPGNKSGRNYQPEYPIFNSRKTSYVYYNKPHIQRGVYRKDDFYFAIDPYSIDSLDEFETKSLYFDGEFTSANIFPPFRESLRVQQDLSLGFITQTPEIGYPTYVDKGRYFQTIYLSNRGLRGGGMLDYLTSRSECDDFIFYPDSMNAYPQRFEMKQQIQTPEYPSIVGNQIYQHWEPYENQLFVQSRETPFSMFAEAKMTGALRLRPEKVEGQGMMEFLWAEMNSKDFSYASNAFEVENSSFNLKREDGKGFNFQVDDVAGKVDFTTRYGQFTLNNDSGLIQIPPVQYISTIDMFKWYMDESELDLMDAALVNKAVIVNAQMDAEKLIDSDYVGAEFISVHPKQDSLRFYAPLANYKIKDSLLVAQSVKTILVADAALLPGDGIVSIDAGAAMRTLEQARIVADTANRYHTFYEAEINVFGRKSYTASGSYDYIDEQNRKQTISFSVIDVNDSLQTYALADIPEEQNFTLSPHFRYQGRVKLDAPIQWLNFEGHANLVHACELVNPGWFYFDTLIDPLEIYIPIREKIRDKEQNYLAAGVFMNKDSIHIYSSFLSKPKRRDDIKHITVSGLLTFDKTDRAYRIASYEKLQNPDAPGPMLSLSVDACKLEAEGLIDIGVYAGQIKIHSAGKIVHDLTLNEVEMNLMMVMDFYFPESILNLMADKMISNYEMEAADLSDEIFLKAMYELLPVEEADAALKNLSMYGEYRRTPELLESSLVLTNIHLAWNSEQKTYESIEDVSIGNMGKKGINRIAPSKFEFLKTRVSNEFTAYFQAGSEQWYFMEYKRNNLFVVSSDDAFNFGLKDLKADDRRNTIKGEPPLTIVPANERKKRYFLEKYSMDDEEEFYDD